MCHYFAKLETVITNKGGTIKQKKKRLLNEIEEII